MKAFPLVALLLSSLVLEAATPASALLPAPAPQTVTVIVSSLASTHSVVTINFYNNSEQFLKSGQHTIHLLVRPEGKNTISVPVQLAPGEWAIALSQDTNDNEKLDKNFLGIPTEPYAFSNNIRPRFAAPKFEECKFVVDGPGKVVNITLK